MYEAIISIGTNLEPKKNFEKVRPLLENVVKVKRYATLVQTPAWGDPSGPPFLNSGALIETAMDKATLKQSLRAIEGMLGRVRTLNPNAPRTMDLDIIVWRGKIVDADVHARDFLQNIVRELLPEVEWEC